MKDSFIIKHQMYWLSRVRSSKKKLVVEKGFEGGGCEDYF
jgi:hypothetical protein